MVLRVEIAGVRNRDLRVSVEGDIVVVRGVRGQPPESEEVLRHHQLEIELGPFEARVRIPVAFDRGGVSARLEEGVLVVRLPKQGPRRIEVRREEDGS